MTISDLPQPVPEARREQPDSYAEGQKLINHMIAAKFHPVLVFGTQATGKTLFLLSLIDFAVRLGGRDINVQLGPPVFPDSFRGFPPSYTGAADLHENAEMLVNEMVPQFQRGNPPARTQLSAPFFVPLNVTVSTRQRRQEFKLAFLESMGEWYGPDAEKSFRFREFQPLLSEVIEHFSPPLSAIFVAPCRAETTQSLSLTDAHRCLANCINRYKSHRLTKGIRDNVLLLVTKWDRAFEPEEADFAGADGNTVLTELRQQGAEIWQNFQGPGLRAARFLSPYSSAWIGSNNRMIPHEDHAHIFDRFNKTLWNWLYGNVTQVAGNREVLYPEVALPRSGRYGTVLSRLLFLPGSWQGGARG